MDDLQVEMAAEIEALLFQVELLILELLPLVIVQMDQALTDMKDLLSIIIMIIA